MGNVNLKIVCSLALAFLIPMKAVALTDGAEFEPRPAPVNRTPTTPVAPPAANTGVRPNPTYPCANEYTCYFNNMPYYSQQDPNLGAEYFIDRDITTNNNLCAPTSASMALDAVLRESTSPIKTDSFTYRFSSANHLDKIRMFFKAMDTSVTSGTLYAPATPFWLNYGIGQLPGRSGDFTSGGSTSRSGLWPLEGTGDMAKRFHYSAKQAPIVSLELTTKNAYTFLGFGAEWYSFDGGHVLVGNGHYRDSVLFYDPQRDYIPPSPSSGSSGTFNGARRAYSEGGLRAETINSNQYGPKGGLNAESYYLKSRRFETGIVWAKVWFIPVFPKKVVIVPAASSLPAFGSQLRFLADLSMGKFSVANILDAVKSFWTGSSDVVLMYSKGNHYRFLMATTGLGAR